MKTPHYATLAKRDAHSSQVQLGWKTRVRKVRHIPSKKKRKH